MTLVLRGGIFVFVSWSMETGLPCDLLLQVPIDPVNEFDLTLRSGEIA